MARRFFYVCAGMLMLAMSFYFGARSATAQGNVIGAVVNAFPGTPLQLSFMTQSGDVYFAEQIHGNGTYQVTHYGNVLAAQPTPTTRQSWGQVKQRYSTPGRAGSSRGSSDR